MLHTLFTLSFHLLAIFCLGYQLEEISMTPIIIFIRGEESIS